MDIQCVKNGAHFCVLIERRSGLTYQLGNDMMSDPEVDQQSAVTLTELRDASFVDAASFACGDYFVIG